MTLCLKVQKLGPRFHTVLSIICGNKRSKFYRNQHSKKVGGLQKTGANTELIRCWTMMMSPKIEENKILQSTVLSLTMKNSTWAWCLPTRLGKSWHFSTCLWKLSHKHLTSLKKLLTLKELRRFGSWRRDIISTSPKPILRLSTFPFTTWPWKVMTYSKFKMNLLLRINLCTKDESRWYVKNKYGSSFD